MLVIVLALPALADEQKAAEGELPIAPHAAEAPPSTTSAATPAPAPKACQIAIMSLQTKGLPADQAHVAELLSDSMATEIASATSCRVITQADIVEMLDFEAQKAACSEASESCLAEIGGALGVERVIGGSVGMLGSSFKLQIKLQNVAQGRVEKRIDRTIKGDPELLDVAARNAVRELFDLPPLDEAAAATKGGAQASSSSSSGQATEGTSSDPSSNGDDATEAEGGSVVGTALLGAGIAAAVLGVVVAVIGTGLFAWVEASVATSAVPHFGLPRNTLLLIDASGVGLLAAGLVVAAIGGGVAVGGAMME